MDDFGERPILPEEAKSLNVHVGQCAVRYAKLVIEINKLRRALNRMQIIFGIQMVPLCYIAWEMLKKHV